MSQIRVLHILSSLTIGGAENFVMNLYKNINKDNVIFDFIVFSNEEGIYEKEVLNNGSIIFRCPRYKLINHKEFCNWWKTFFETHKEYKILHSHIRSVASIIFKISKKYGIINIAHSHSTSNGRGLKALLKNCLQKKIPKYADYLMACSLDAGIWLYGKKYTKKLNFYVINM